MITNIDIINGLNTPKQLKKIIVSLTSFPYRIKTLHIAIDSILNQTLKPDAVYLYLANEQFPNKEKDLPESLLALEKHGLSIKWCSDIKSYKKLIPALHEHPDDIIVTADDDLIFEKDWLKTLYNSYLAYPADIHAHRITRLYFKDNQNLEIINRELYWAKTNVFDYEGYIKEPSFLNKLTGGSGALYPPNCFIEDILNEDLFTRLAPTSDDIWFWLMAALKGVKVRVPDSHFPVLNYIEGTQEKFTLSSINDRGEKLFFVHLRNILDYYPKLREILRSDTDDVSHRLFAKQNNE